MNASTYRVPTYADRGDTLSIPVGNASAEVTLHIYEDLRGLADATYERASGAAVRKFADDGRIGIAYHFGTGLDQRLGGYGSLAALNALGAAADAGIAQFGAYHSALYANQPPEDEDRFSDAEFLLDLADQVPALRSDAFDQAVREGAFLPWAADVSAAFTAAETATPTLRVGDRVVQVVRPNGKAVGFLEVTAQIDLALDFEGED